MKTGKAGIYLNRNLHDLTTALSHIEDTCRFYFDTLCRPTVYKQSSFLFLFSKIIIFI